MCVVTLIAIWNDWTHFPSVIFVTIVMVGLQRRMVFVFEMIYAGVAFLTATRYNSTVLELGSSALRCTAIRLEEKKLNNDPDYEYKR
jgi:hypothetical protein